MPHEWIWSNMSHNYPYQEPDLDSWSREQGFLSGDSDLSIASYRTSPKSRMKRFLLLRHKDMSGISGTGPVAEGVQFSDGACYISWLTAHNSEGRYSSIQVLLDIHGHDGNTEVIWMDV
jgi:hypothetical protein